MADEDDTYKFIEDAVLKACESWLSKHSIAVQDSMEAAVNQATTCWLDAHSNEILDRIADIIARKIWNSTQT